MSFRTGSKRSPDFSTRCNTLSEVKTSKLGIAFFQAIFHLLPGNRRGDGRLVFGAQRVDVDGGFVIVVLAPVDKDSCSRAELSSCPRLRDRDGALPAAAQWPWQTAWSVRMSRRCSGERKPEGPWSRRSWQKPAIRTAQKSRAPRVRPGSTARCWRAHRDQDRRQ